MRDDEIGGQKERKLRLASGQRAASTIGRCKYVKLALAGDLLSRFCLPSIALTQLVQVCRQFRLRGPTHQEIADHLLGSQCRLATGVQADQHAGDDGTVRLDLDARRPSAEEFPATEHLFE